MAVENENDLELKEEVVYGPPEKKENPTLWDQLEESFVAIGCIAIVNFMIFGGLVFIGMVYFLPNMWIFGLLYLAWMYYDKDTPYTGGRRSEIMRNLIFWRYRRDYFPIKLVKTAELPPDTTYLFGSFPHGMIVFGASTNFCSEVNHCNEVFPGLRPYVITLNTHFNVPFTRDVLLGFGICASTKESISSILKGPPGNVCVLTVGGIQEAMLARPGTYKIVLKERKGFVKLALKAGSSLVPVFSFGENDAYDQPSSERYLWWQSTLRAMTRSPLISFSGRGIGHWLPYQRPITTVVGKAIKLPKDENPSQELIEKYHAIFTEELQKLFDKYKGKYDVAGEKAVLEII